MITSTSNNQIKNLCNLQKKAKVRNEQKAFVVEGIKMFREAKFRNLIVKAYVSESFVRQHQEEMVTMNGMEYEIVSDSVYKTLSDTVSPQGISAIVHMPEYSFDKILEQKEARLLLLEDLQDPGNAGTIVRTAEGAGMDGVILTKNSVDLFNPKVIRSTMGALYRMPFLYVDSMKDAVDKLHEHGFSLYAAHLNGKADYDQVEYSRKTGIIIGNESRGIQEDTAKQADTLVKIPMEGQVESLNAAVAAAIFMYEVYRQRR